MNILLQRTSSGLWEADRLLQEEEEEYLDVSDPAWRAKAFHTVGCSHAVMKPFTASDTAFSDTYFRRWHFLVRRSNKRCEATRRSWRLASDAKSEKLYAHKRRQYNE